MFKSCSKCGKIHASNYQCNVRDWSAYKDIEERKLRSRHAWTCKSKEIRSRANYLCEVCRDQGTYTHKGLEVHHIEKVKDNKNLFLDDNNLICLCIEHHKLADQGEIDPDYLRKLVYQREIKNDRLGSGEF